MKSTVSVHDFRQAFHNCMRGDQFSYDALGLIFDYFEEYEDSYGAEVELDPIAICCDFNESTEAEIIQDYDYPNDDWRTYLQDNTCVVGETDAGTVVYQSF